MWKISQTKEQSLAQECSALQTMIKGLQDTLELQCNMKDENSSLRRTINTLEEKLQAAMQEHQKKIDLMMSDMRTKEEALKAKLQKMHCEMEAKLLLKEEEKNKQLSKMEMELCELTQRLQTQEKEKQSELIKQQIEFSAKLARIENRNTKSHSETSTLSQNIYRMKLQHLQEEKNREIEGLRNTIKNLEKRLGGDSDSRLKRRRF
ncbi:coiled-coil domain-containing protein 152 isoform X2 [Hyperolius riggenbachi]